MSDLHSPASGLPFPREGRIAGIDFGTVRIGVAITDPLRILASPLEDYTRKSPERDAEHFRELAARESVAGFVVGLPVHASGDESQKSREAREFGRWLAEVSHRPVCYFDERYTTRDARQLMINSGAGRKKRRGPVDALAAVVLLRAFLDAGPDAANQRPASYK